VILVSVIAAFTNVVSASPLSKFVVVVDNLVESVTGVV